MLFLGDEDGARHIRTGEMLDIRDFGAKCDGVTGDGWAIQRAVNEAQGLLSAVVLLGRQQAIEQTIVINRGVTIQGGSSRSSIIIPKPELTGWVFSVEGNGRNGEFAVLNTSYNRANDQSGTAFKGFHIFGDRAYAHNGIRVQREDDLFIDDVQFSYLKGTALQLGASSIASGVGSVRESDLRRVKIYACGDLGGTPGLIVQNAPTGSGDGTNQVYFQQLRYVYNMGGMVFQNHNSGETIRRLIFNDVMVHGASHPSTGTLVDHDLMTFSGGIISVIIHNMMCNSTGNDPLAIFKAKANPGDSTKRPQGIQVTNLQADQILGDVFSIDSCSDFSIEGRFAVAGITGAIVRVGATANLLCYEVKGIGATFTPPAAKFVIPATFKPRGTVTWGGIPVTVP